MRLREAFLSQSAACAALGSPFMERLMALFADRLDPGGSVGGRLAAWPGDIGPSGASLPLRLAGALHALRLQGDPALAAVYPPSASSSDALWTAVASVLDRRSAEILRWIESAPQTNEVRRSAGVIAAAAVAGDRFGLPLIASDLGASAGLNLMFDRYALRAGGATLGALEPAVTLVPDWTGPPPPRAAFTVARRRGVDLAPLDPRSAEGRLRLLAYLWPDQPERIAMTEAAAEVASAAVDRGEAIAWLETRLAPVRGHTRFVFHTVAWQYFPAEAQARGAALLAAAGAAATAEAPLARYAMEADGAGPGAAMTLDLWPDGERLDLGRIDFHGRWVDWRGP